MTENNERYEEIDEDSFFDNESEEVVFTLDEKANEDILRILAERENKID